MSNSKKKSSTELFQVDSVSTEGEGEVPEYSNIILQASLRNTISGILGH